MATPNKKLIILVSSLVPGGAERRAADLCNYFFQRGYDVSLVTLNKEVCYDICEGVSKFKASNLGGRDNKILQFIYVVFHSFRLKRIFNQINPDIVVSFLIRANFFNVFFKNKFSYKSIVSIRTYSSEAYRKGWRAFLFKRVLKYIGKKADRIIANSQASRIDLIDNFQVNHSKAITIYNPYNILEITRLASEDVSHPWFCQDIPVIISAGRLARGKGQWHLIRAFSLLRKKQKARLVILGEGDLKDYLKKLVSDLKLKDSVLFLGWQKNPFKYIAKSSLFVFPSLCEGFPNALVEAMICGVPVISTDCFSGPSEILEGGRHGVLIPVGSQKFSGANDPVDANEKILAEKMAGLLGDKSLKEKFVKNGLRRVNDFSIEKIMPEYERVLFD